MNADYTAASVRSAVPLQANHMRAVYCREEVQAIFEFFSSRPPNGPSAGRARQPRGRISVTIHLSRCRCLAKGPLKGWPIATFVIVGESGTFRALGLLIT